MESDAKMINYIMWGIAFFSLYISVVWISFLYLLVDEKNKYLKNYPSVTIAVPAYNEQDTILKTIDSLLKLDYPKDKLSIVVVNDGSKDNTKEVVEAMASEKDNVDLINKKNAGKAAALNTALEKCSTELFGCVDADSYVDKDALRNILPYFGMNNTASVISAIKVNKAKNIYEKLQKFEYLIAILSRKLMASIETLAMTPGVLSLYKTKILKNIGCFDEGNITEDFEIALRLKFHKYNIRIAEEAITYTNVPPDFMTLWRQRIRWYRGFIDNHVKYKDMFFSRKHGLMGFFQLPLNILGVVLLIVGVIFISYELIRIFYEFLLRNLVIKNYLLNYVFEIPSFKDLILGHNMKIMFPIYIATLAGLYLFYVAHKMNDEKLRNPVSIWAYFFLLPYLTCVHWIGAILEHIFGVKKKW